MRMSENNENERARTNDHMNASEYANNLVIPYTIPYTIDVHGRCTISTIRDTIRDTHKQFHTQ